MFYRFKLNLHRNDTMFIHPTTTTTKSLLKISLKSVFSLKQSKNFIWKRKRKKFFFKNSHPRLTDQTEQPKFPTLHLTRQKTKLSSLILQHDRSSGPPFDWQVSPVSFYCVSGREYCHGPNGVGILACRDFGRVGILGCRDFVRRDSGCRDFGCRDYVRIPREINRMLLISRNSISDVLRTPEVHGIKKK